MSKRFIGIDIGAQTIRVAILNREKGQLSVGSLLERSYGDQEELVMQLRDLLAAECNMGDQLVASLPARSAYVRRLEFPFQDEKKIAAALPFELSAQLPVSMEECATAMQKVQVEGERSVVTAAAVPRETLTALLALVESAEVPLHRVDLAPFCHVASLGEQIGDGLLVCASQEETTVCLLQAGRLADYRVLPPAAQGEAMAHFQKGLLRDLRVLAHAAATENLTISLMGDAVTPELKESLQHTRHPVEELALHVGGQLVDSAFLPAVALAQRAKAERGERSFNFRKGEYALKGEWANLRRKLVLLAALLGMALVILGGSMLVKYLDKSQRAEQLQTEMVTIYRALFPQAGAIVDVPLQLQSAIRDLQERNRLLANRQASALAVLKELSELPELVTLEIEEFAMGPDSLKLTGQTASFEAVNQMARILEGSPLFRQVQVTDAKMSLDGNQIDFRLALNYVVPGGGE